MTLCISSFYIILFYLPLIKSTTSYRIVSILRDMCIYKIEGGKFGEYKFPRKRFLLCSFFGCSVACHERCHFPYLLDCFFCTRYILDNFTNFTGSTSREILCMVVLESRYDGIVLIRVENIYGYCWIQGYVYCYCCARFCLSFLDQLASRKTELLLGNLFPLRIQGKSVVFRKVAFYNQRHY